MKYLLIPVMMILGVASLFGKKTPEIRFPVSDIAPSLRQNAHAIIRNDSVELHVISLNKVKYRKTTAITILDAKGADYAKFVCGYNLYPK